MRIMASPSSLTSTTFPSETSLIIYTVPFRLCVSRWPMVMRRAFSSIIGSLCQTLGYQWHPRAQKVVYLSNRNVELKNMTFLDSTFETEKVGSQSSGIQHDFSPAIPAANRDSILDIRSALSILVSTILADDIKFDVHIFSEMKW